MDSDDRYIHFLLCEKMNLSDMAMDYHELMRFLLNIEFKYYISDDANRAADGLELRGEFTDKYGQHSLSFFEEDPSSVLEMMVALAIRFEYSVMSMPGEEKPERWFLEMLRNLGLDLYDDASLMHGWKSDVRDIVDNWLTRSYGRNGFGSIFPLVRSTKDQRKMPIWTQMCNYVDENYC